jgi:hypothetical protein
MVGVQNVINSENSQEENEETKNELTKEYYLAWTLNLLH